MFINCCVTMAIMISMAGTIMFIVVPLLMLVLMMMIIFIGSSVKYPVAT